MLKLIEAYFGGLFENFLMNKCGFSTLLSIHNVLCGNVIVGIEMARYEIVNNLSFTEPLAGELSHRMLARHIAAHALRVVCSLRRTVVLGFAASVPAQ